MEKPQPGKCSREKNIFSALYGSLWVSDPVIRIFQRLLYNERLRRDSKMENHPLLLLETSTTGE
jgi:hypothetical protein